MDPCGMWSDYIERPFSIAARLFRDSDVEVTQHWYFAAPGAKQLPFVTPINVPVWLTAFQQKPGVGALQNAIPLLDKPTGVNPKPPGDHYHGTEDDYRLGCVYDPAGPVLARADDGIPLECRAPPGGVAMGGTSRVGPLVPLEVSGGYDAHPFTILDCSLIAPHPVGYYARYPYNPAVVGGFPCVTVTGFAVGPTYRVWAAQEGTRYNQMQLVGNGGIFSGGWEQDVSGAHSWVWEDVLPAGTVSWKIRWQPNFADPSPVNGPLLVFVGRVT